MYLEQTAGLVTLDQGPQAIPENKGIQKMEIQFFSVENNSMWTSFSKKFVTL